ncbi:class I SAM-dependent methyltransferase, partial [bacterium]|nr:class I SAM-dependent methyltransferase [bacterium]
KCFFGGKKMLMFKSYFLRLHKIAEENNFDNIKKCLEYQKDSLFLDLGCDDGKKTCELAKTIGTDKLYGIEIRDEQAKIAESREIIVKRCNLNERFDFNDESFDIICSNQVIEHLYNTDNFISEIYRVLKPGGYAVISTENLSSWHNILSLCLGWQPFSLTNISLKSLGIGNPLSLHRNKQINSSSNEHMRLFAYRGLKEIFQIYGFKVESITGAGYYPFPEMISKFDSKHSAFLTIKVRK